MLVIFTTTMFLPLVLLTVISFRAATTDLGAALAVDHPGYDGVRGADRILTAKATGRADRPNVPHDHDTHTELVALLGTRSYGWLARDAAHGPVAHYSTPVRGAGHGWALGAERYSA